MAVRGARSDSENATLAAATTNATASVCRIRGIVVRNIECGSGCSDWRRWVTVEDRVGVPTIPQLYLNGTFVGGCDIVREMHETGELPALIVGSGKPTSS